MVRPTSTAPPPRSRFLVVSLLGTEAARRVEPVAEPVVDPHDPLQTEPGGLARPLVGTRSLVDERLGRAVHHPRHPLGVLAAVDPEGGQGVVDDVVALLPGLEPALAGQRQIPPEVAALVGVAKPVEVLVGVPGHVVVDPLAAEPDAPRLLGVLVLHEQATETEDRLVVVDRIEVVVVIVLAGLEEALRAELHLADQVDALGDRLLGGDADVPLDGRAVERLGVEHVLAAGALHLELQLERDLGPAAADRTVGVGHVDAVVARAGRVGLRGERCGPRRRGEGERGEGERAGRAGRSSVHGHSVVSRSSASRDSANHSAPRPLSGLPSSRTNSTPGAPRGTRPNVASPSTS